MDSLSITLITIIVFSFFSAFIKGRRKDRCLKKIDDFFVHIYNGKEKIIWGRTEVESNALVIDFESEDKNSNKNFFLYKNEFKNMQLILRLHKYFDEDKKRKRDKLYKKLVNPGFFSKFQRKLGNVFSSAKDAISEIINTIIMAAKNMGPLKSISSGTNQLDKLKEESVNTITGNSYEPIWERYIGKNVIVEAFEDKSIEMKGVLVEYSQNYICLFDATIDGIDEEGAHDLLINRSYGTTRHVVK